MQRMRATVMGLRHRTTAVTGTQLRLLCLGPTLLLLSIRAAAAPCDFKFVDKDGDEWDLETLSGVRTSSGPATTGTYTYKFDICANISPNPTSCELAGVYGTVAARYQSSLCEQLGPDHNLNADEVEIKKVTVGADAGVSLMWSSTESGTRSFELKITCGPSSLIGTATAGNAPVIQWTHPSVCDGPIGGAGPGGDDTGGSLEWGVLALIAMTVSGVLYVGGGSYRNKQAGAEGWDAMPNASFWSQLPGLVADGVYFSRMKLSAAHPSLAFVAPSGLLPSLAAGGDEADELRDNAGVGVRRKGRGQYETLGEELGGTSEKTRLVGDTSGEPPVLLPRKGTGKHASGRMVKTRGMTQVRTKAKPKPKPKLPSGGRKPAAAALE